ncbi:MAG: N-6 DNA methylase [Candidatus Poribacteria bacterium]|nr:N-6 DNA methylase [Candidatus Poribacteria bacterium]
MTTTNDYLDAIEGELQTGNATEHSYRPMLKQFLDEWSQNFSPSTDYSITNEPQRIAGNAPDFLVQSREVSLGWIETKPPGTDLDTEETSEQLTRYRKAFPNLILTDYLEFRLYNAGENRLSVRISDLAPTTNHLINRNTDDSEVSLFLTAFFGAEPLRIGRASDLARMLSGKAQLLKAEIADLLQNTSNDELQNRLAAFREHLIADLSEAKFADMMAQTITYSLFAARCYHTHGKFNRTRAIEILAETNPFLSQLFWVSIQRLTHLHWIIDPIAELLDLADMEGIIADFGTEGRKAGPIIHFYEDFLSDYDPKIRRQRGVYYTPESVVSYIVRSVDRVLTEQFNLSNGLAHTGTVNINGKHLPKVQILDPAAGTGTFLRLVISQIYHTIITGGMAGAWQEYVPQHLLPRLHGFERMVAPYTMCHLTLTHQLRELEHNLNVGERLNVYLTDTLEARDRQEGFPIFVDEIAKEAESAVTVKRDLPVMVIVKNPPYLGESENNGEWITNLLRGLDGNTSTEDYFKVDGQSLDERNSKWLNDDYVKFIRFAQWRIARTGYGILAFISNHSYLNNLTFRGMRQSLMRTFDTIYILDLHGNKRTNEKPPDGGRDDNVFNIQQGVAIGIFIKNAPEKLSPTRIYHTELWGDREDKYNWLDGHDIDTTPWDKLTPESPNYLLVPYNESVSEEYERYWKLTDIFPLNNGGTITKRDKMVIDFEPAPILERVNYFRNSTESNEQLCQQLPIRMNREWDVDGARESLRSEQNLERHIQPILYRPYDERFIFYHDALVARRTVRVMRHLLAGENVAMCVGRTGQAVGDTTWNIVSISKTIANLNLFRRGGIVVFPLYRYAEQRGQRSHNMSQQFLEEVCRHLNYEIDHAARLHFIPDGKGDGHTTIGPADIFHYIYAILHAPEYRQRYADQLKIDFPYIPLTTNRALFQKLTSLGEKLVTMHLFQSEDTNLPDFPESGTSEVEAVHWSEIDQRVWINSIQYFAPIPREVWEFRVGGHRPAEKWLTDRALRTLTFDDIQHYRRICGALEKTVKIMEDIDNTIAEHGGWPLENKA